MEEIKVYTLTEAADILKISRRTLYNAIKNKQLKAVKLGREWRITHANLKDFIANGSTKQK
jgi:excisionase family DNA binding protein